jgi:predicted enzyme related to lactoylglutathione lyase
MEADVERLVGLGASRIEQFDEPYGTWTVMADPEGNEFCVASPE